MKRSQLYGQIFIYILTIFLISFILVYGYNAVQNFKERAEKVYCLKFRNDLKSAVDVTLADFGTVKRKDLQLCSGLNEVCFVETLEDFDRSNPKSNVAELDPILRDSISSGTEKNVYLVGGEAFYAGIVSVDNDVLCIKSINNKISLRLEGKGDHVLLSKWV